MRIGLYNLEPKYKNLALEKLRLYYSQQGQEVEDYIALEKYDKVYASSIFTFTRKDNVPPMAVCGGTGFDLITTLPSEIDRVKPHLNFGFTTRGCSRNCSPCVVPQKEGGIRIEGDLYDLWDGEGRLITLLDNNILAMMHHFEYICRQSLTMRVKLDFNQGLDCRYLNSDAVSLLHRISHVEYKFAFDSPLYYKSVERAIGLLKDGGINRSVWYVLVGYNTSFQEDLDRVNFLRRHGQQVYVMRYGRKRNDWQHIALAQWCNQHHIFYSMTFDEFLNTEHSRARKYNKLVHSCE